MSLIASALSGSTLELTVMTSNMGSYNKTNSTDLNEVWFTTTHIKPTIGKPDTVIISINLTAC